MMGDPAPPSDFTAPYVFISYASADRDRVMPVVEALRRVGVPVWLDEVCHWADGWDEHALLAAA